mgnify:FL=1
MCSLFSRYTQKMLSTYSILVSKISEFRMLIEEFSKILTFDSNKTRIYRQPVKVHASKFILRMHSNRMKFQWFEHLSDVILDIVRIAVHKYFEMLSSVHVGNHSKTILIALLLLTIFQSLCVCFEFQKMKIILINANICLECDFFIHEHCQVNVPPMCTIPYKEIGRTMSGSDIFTTCTRLHPPLATIDPSDKGSQSSSADLSWLGPLPGFDQIEMNRHLFPKLEDFEYIGRLGDGASAQVYCVEHRASKKFLAIKVVNGKDEQSKQQLEVERQILFRFSYGNPYMIKPYCASHHGVRR